jgi:hypothetical protein
MASKYASGSVYRRMAKFVFERWGDRCHLHLCTHHNARHLDHVEPQTENEARKHDVTNLRPVHGSPGNPCRECSQAAGKNIYCNQIRGGYTIDRAIRKLRELTGLPIPDYGKPAQQPRAREW